MNGLIKKTVIVAVFLLSGLLFSHDGYWAPSDPPKSGYMIDVSVDMKTNKIEGRETISMKNNTGLPIEIIAIDWRISETCTIDIKTGSRELELINETKNGHAVSPLFYRLPKPLKPGVRLHLKIEFTQSFEISDDHTKFGSTSWYPRLWWNGLPVHDAFSVKLDIPDGYALAVSGRLNKETGRYEIPGAKTFGLYLGRDQKAITREVEGVKVTTLSTEKGAPCAAACMETALDAIAYYKEWLGLYPFDFLYIIPGGSGRWGGYPFATGIVVIHGQETFKPDEKTIHWKRITAHEIGHEYWGEWVLDPDDPAWVWIGMGIFADTEYMLTRGFDPKRRQGWMSNYLKGLRMFYDTTVDIPPDIEETIQYDRNNTVIHSKGYSIVSALDAVLGRKTFERVYKKILREYGGRRLGWKDLQQVFEADSGRDLSWFFNQWVRSNAYLCYQVESRESKQVKGGYISSVKVKQLGTMSMPVPIKAVFEDGSSMVAFTRRNLETTKLTFNSKSKLKEVILNPDHKLAMLEKPVPELSKEAAKALAWGWSLSDIGWLYEVLKDEIIPSSDIWYRLGMYLYDGNELNKALNCFRKVDSLHKEGTTKFAAHGWMGLIYDLKGSREQALKYYKSGLKYDTGKPMKHSRLRINMDRGWFEERLKIPFTYGTKIEIPDNPTSDELQSILSDLAWQREGKTPLLIYEKAKGVKIDRIRFWFKLGMLLYDSKYYTESFDTFSRVLDLEPSELYTFTVYTWLGHVRDLLGEREEALQLYRKALEHDTGDAMTHSQYRMRINRQWVEKRLKAPFTR